MALFKENERNALYERLRKIGQSDERVIGGALVGSFALDRQDEWSDLDISFGVKDDVKPKKLLDEWITLLNVNYDIVHYFDVPSSLAIYRVILFSNGLEVDLSVVPESEYGAKSPTFKILFGKALNENGDFPKPSPESMFGWGWHHVLHANSSLKRGKLWQAEFWISSLRNIIISVKCLHMGLPSAHGRGVDQLPENELRKLDEAIVRKMELQELKRALNVNANLLIREIENSNQALAKDLSVIFNKALKNVL